MKYITLIKYDDGEVYILPNEQWVIDWHIDTMKLNGINVVQITSSVVDPARN